MFYMEFLKRIKPFYNANIQKYTPSKKNKQQCSHTTAYRISVCQRMLIRSHTQKYVRRTKCLRPIRFKYGEMGRAKLIFWTWSNCSIVCERIAFMRYSHAYAIRLHTMENSYAHHMIGVRCIYQAYVENARHTLKLRQSYVGINGGRLS